MVSTKFLSSFIPSFAYPFYLLFVDNSNRDGSH